MKSKFWTWLHKTADARAIVAFAAGVIMSCIVLGVVLYLLNQSVDVL